MVNIQRGREPPPPFGQGQGQVTIGGKRGLRATSGTRTRLEGHEVADSGPKAGIFRERRGNRYEAEESALGEKL
jgi:hypothetical protein